ncbi:MAG: riboflavin synthase [Candidatus Melainabacteria bacterium]|nr:riboflavin synthase [Candidatus Melainabacteria bacterium]
MFTGLVEEEGTIAKLEREGTNLNIEVKAQQVLDDMKLGDSIAIDGVCQTVTKISADSFWVTAIDETLKLTNFNDYAEGTKVNLERCLRAQDRLGGHIVQGHVDAVARLVSIDSVDGSYEVVIEVPAELNRYIIHKGSIAFNGISLTVAAIDGNQVKVCIIPKTWEMTNLSDLKPGSAINLEVDLLAKYLEKLAVPA